MNRSNYGRNKDNWKNETWDVTDLSKGKISVGCIWIFKIKYKVDGTIEWYKVGLVAKEMIQTYEIDYIEIFVLVARLNTIWIFYF